MIHSTSSGLILSKAEVLKILNLKLKIIWKVMESKNLDTLAPCQSVALCEGQKIFYRRGHFVVGATLVVARYIICLFLQFFNCFLHLLNLLLLCFDGFLLFI